MAEATSPSIRPDKFKFPLPVADLPLWIALAILAVPTIASLGQQVWNTEAGAHGPIVVAVGGWLLFQELAGAKDLKRPGSMVLTLAVLILSLALYVFGRAFDFISLEVAGLYGTGVSMLYSRIGLRALTHLWFPVAYLAFLVPPPGWVMDELTAPLKQFVSWASMSVLSAAGIPVAREGVTIYVAGYQLLVEDACSGMNSMVGLVAVSLLYIYLLRGSHLRYATLLVLASIPIAIVGNILRIMTLILLTYFFGDEVAQGFLHQVSGIFLFAVDLLLVFMLDQFLWKVLPASWKDKRA
jgi:exosortase